MYDYEPLISDYVQAASSGIGLREAAGKVMKELYEKGNVELLNRPQVSPSVLEGAGWENVGSSTETLFTLWYSAGTDGVEWIDDIILHMTPIRKNGTVEAPTHLDEYVDSLLAGTNSVSGILEADKEENGGRGLVICIQRVQNGWNKAHSDADVYDNTLSALQDIYYFNGTSSVPTANELTKIAAWYYVYSIYIKNYKTKSGDYVANETLLYSIPIEAGNENVLIDPKVTSDMGKAGSFEFSMHPGHPYFESLCQMKTIFRVVYDGDQIFRGRVLTIDVSHLTGDKQVHCEGDLAFLLDSQIEGVPDNNREKSSAYSYMQTLIAAHNDQMSGYPDKQFSLGEVPGTYTNVTDAGQRAQPDSDYRYGSGSWRDSQSAWNELTDSFGGFLRTRYQNGTCYIDWLNNYFRRNVNEQTIELGKNLIGITSSSEVNNIFTAVIPVGSNDGKNIYINGYKTDIHGNTNYILVPQITQVFSDEELNSGFHSKADYEDAVNRYGIIFHTESFSNADTQSKLWSYATDWIKNNYIGGLDSFNVSALDMHVIGESNAKFLTGDQVNVIYPNVDKKDTDPEATICKTLTIMGITYVLHNPDKNTYNIGVPNAILKKNYGEKQRNKTRSSYSSGISSSLAAEEKKRQEEQEKFESSKSYYDSTIWSWVIDAARHSELYQEYKNKYGDEAAGAIMRIAEIWLGQTRDNVDSDYGAISIFMSGHTQSIEIKELGTEGQEALRSLLLTGADHGIKIYGKNRGNDDPSVIDIGATDTGAQMSMRSEKFAYKVSVHSRNGQSINMRAATSSSSNIVAQIPSDATVYCKADPTKDYYLAQWVHVEWMGYKGYILKKFIPGTSTYDQGDGYKPPVGEDRTPGLGVTTLLNSDDGTLSTSGVKLSPQDMIEKFLGGSGIPNLDLTADSSSVLGGDGEHVFFALTGQGGENGKSGGISFKKLFIDQLGNEATPETTSVDGEKGRLEGLQVALGGSLEEGLNSIKEGLEDPTLLLDGVEGILEAGTGEKDSDSTVKISGKEGREWVGRNPSTGAWRVKLNDVVEYTGTDGKTYTASGYVSADDFKLPSVNSFKTKLAVMDTAIVGKADVAELTAVKAVVDKLTATNITANTIEANTYINSFYGKFKNVYVYNTLYVPGPQDSSGESTMANVNGAFNDAKFFVGTGNEAGLIKLNLYRLSGTSHSINFNIADTKFYKDAVSAAGGIESTGSWQWDSDDSKYVREIVAKNGEKKVIELPTITPEVTTVTTEENKYYIGALAKIDKNTIATSDKSKEATVTNTVVEANEKQNQNGIFDITKKSGGSVSIGGKSIPVDVEAFSLDLRERFASEQTAGRNSVRVGSAELNEPVAEDDTSQSHGKKYTITGLVQLEYQTGVADNKPVYENIGPPVGITTKDITAVYNAGWEAGNISGSVTELSGVWGSGKDTGKLTITASPQNVNYWVLITQGAATRSGETVTIPIMATDSKNGATPYQSGQNVYITVSAGTATPEEPVWNPGTARYDISAVGSFSVLGFNYDLAKGSIANGFVPDDAFRYGRNSVSVKSAELGNPSVDDDATQAHGKKYTIAGLVQLQYQSGVDGSGEPVYTDIGNPVAITKKNITSVYNDGYAYGASSVAPTGIRLASYTVNSPTNVRASLVVPYTGNTTGIQFNDVDVTSVYQAGYNAGSTTETYNVYFDVTMGDGKEYERTVKKCGPVNLKDVYNAGANDATPTEPQYYIYAPYGNVLAPAFATTGKQSYHCFLLYPRTKVEHLGTSGRYIKIKYGDKTGYIYDTLIKYELTPTSPTDYPGKVGFASPADYGFNIIASTNIANLNLREGPSTSDGIIMKIQKQGSVLYCESDPNSGPADSFTHVLYKADTNHYVDGYVQNQYIAEGAEPQPDDPATKYIYASNGIAVNARKTASSSGELIGKLKPRTPVTVISGPTNNYYYVKYLAKSGSGYVQFYVAAEYLSDNNNSPTKYTGTGWITESDKELASYTIGNIVHSRTQYGDDIFELVATRGDNATVRHKTSNAVASVPSTTPGVSAENYVKGISYSKDYNGMTETSINMRVYVNRTFTDNTSDTIVVAVTARGS